MKKKRFWENKKNKKDFWYKYKNVSIDFSPNKLSFNKYNFGKKELIVKSNKKINI